MTYVDMAPPRAPRGFAVKAHVVKYHRNESCPGYSSDSSGYLRFITDERTMGEEHNIVALPTS